MRAEKPFHAHEVRFATMDDVPPCGREHDHGTCFAEDAIEQLNLVRMDLPAEYIWIEFVAVEHAVDVEKENFHAARGGG